MEKETEVKTDKRRLKSRTKIKEAFISLHKREGYDGVTITSICEEAHISRSTFYAHYDNVTGVLEEILDEALQETGSFWAKHLDLIPEKEEKNCKTPFCVFVRENDRYRNIFIDDAFSSLIVKKLVDRSSDMYYKYISGYTKMTREQLRAVLVFQTSGCLSITKMGIREKMKRWDCVRGCIDEFVKSGIKGIIEKNEKTK